MQEDGVSNTVPHLRHWCEVFHQPNNNDDIWQQFIELSLKWDSSDSNNDSESRELSLVNCCLVIVSHRH